MSRTSILAAAALTALCFVSGAAINERETLPGARAQIDAAAFPSLQAAFDAIPETGGCVQLPSGTFEIDEPLVIQCDDVCIQGNGTSTHIKNTNRQGLPAIIVADREHKREGNSRDHELWRVRLADFRVTGNPQSGVGILAHNVNEIFIDGVTVSYHGGDGIQLSYCYEDPRVVNSLITYNKRTGLNLVGCHDIVVSANQFEENQDGLNCFDGFNLCMTGNCLDDHLGRGVVIENTYGSVVSGNMIEECQAAALVMDRDCYGNTVSANVIAHNGAGIDLRDAHGCAVSANTFTIMKSDAVRIGKGSGRITVCANSFSDSYIGAGKHKRAENDRVAAGLVLDEAAAVLVDGNTFAGVGPQAITFAALADTPSTITNNLIIETAAGVPANSVEASVLKENHAVVGRR